MKKLLFLTACVATLLFASCKVDVESITLNKTRLSLNEEQSYQLIAAVIPENAEKDVIWISSKPEVATVQNGMVVAKNSGNTTISATVGDKTAECKVTVIATIKVPVTGISIDKTTLNIERGESQKITATVKPSDATNKKVNWSSSNPAVADVDYNEEGKVCTIIGKMGGTAIITAKTVNENKTATCNVTVRKTIYDVTGVSITEAPSITLQEGNTQKLTAVIFPATATNKNVSWESLNNSIASVDQSGTVTAKDMGTTTIVVTTEEGNFTDTCEVVVTAAPKIINGISCVYIPAGTFMMGTSSSENGIDGDEKPSHQVTLTKDYYMSKYEITNAQFAEFLNAKSIGSNGVYNGDTLVKVYQHGVQYNNNKWVPASGYDNYPIVYVTWYGANEYAQWIGGALPTEAQWEYACRAGSTTLYHFDDSKYQLGNYEWYYDNSGNKTQPVGQKLPNAWGLYDMQGNVGEWCADWYGENYYSNSPTIDPTGPSSGTRRVNRGGDVGNSIWECRLTIRSYFYAQYGSNWHQGFRVVFAAE